MARDLNPPPSPAGRPGSSAEAERERALELEEQRRKQQKGSLWHRSPEEDVTEHQPAAALAAESSDDAPPAPKVESPYRSRFGLVLGALLGIAIATLAIGAAVYVGTSGNNGAPDGWSQWKPGSDDGVDAAKEIATHVGRKYRLSDGNQIVGVQAGPLEVFDVPLEVALRTAPQGGNIDFIDGKGLMYTLNGLGPRGSVRGGKPSEARHLLLRREALELALYTFRYVEDVDLVVALLPPKPPAEEEGCDGGRGRGVADAGPVLPPRRPRAAAGDPAARDDPVEHAAAGDDPAGRVAPDRRAHAQQPVPRLLPAGPGPARVPRAGSPTRVGDSGPRPPPPHRRTSWPRHSTTGTRGYFGYAGSVFERRQSENSEPRPVRTSCWCAQVSQRPAGGLLRSAGGRAVPAPHGGA